MKPTLLFYCQHSVGMGHLTRSFAIAQSLVEKFQVVFLNGGPFPPGLSAPEGVIVIDLPPLGMSDGHTLNSRDARFSVEDAKRLRRQTLLEALEHWQPEVVLIELFPFGRKKFAYELLPLLKTARRMARRPVIISSLRDILVNSRPDKQHHDDRARWITQRYFDVVLVHADPRFARLEESFQPAKPLSTPVDYTGFVLPRRDATASAKRASHILVSAGGGMAGMPLFRAALEAQKILWDSWKLPMKLIAGPFLPEQDWQTLENMAAHREGIQLVRSVPDMLAEMRVAAVSVSQCGYNTALDIVASHAPALVVPYSEGREDEQINRAGRMQSLNLLKMMNPALLNGTALAREILKTLDFVPEPSGLDLDGAENTCRLISARHDSAFRKPVFSKGEYDPRILGARHVA